MTNVNQILADIVAEVYHSNENIANENSTDLVLTFFYRPKGSAPSTLSILSSSNKNLFSNMKKIKAPKELDSTTFLGSWLNSADGTTSTKYPDVDREVLKATIISSEIARKLAKDVEIRRTGEMNNAPKDSYGCIQDFERYDNIRKMCLPTIDSLNGNTTHFYENVTAEGEWLVSAVQMDHILHGLTYTVALKRSRYYEYETSSIVGTVVSVILLVLIITALLWVGDERLERFGMTTTALSLGAMFLCFIVVIFMWISSTDKIMVKLVKLLSKQLKKEMVFSLNTFLAVPPAVNRWNYIFAYVGAFELSMLSHWNASATTATQAAANMMRRERNILQVESTLADVMRRRPATGGTKPSLIFAGADDGGFYGCSFSKSRPDGALGLSYMGIDVTTGVKDGHPIRAFYNAEFVPDVGSNIELLRSTSERMKETYNYDPRKRSWYIKQQKTPDMPVWSDVYMFNSEKVLGITATQGWSLDGTKIGTEIQTGSGKHSMVFAVDYTLDIVSQLLKNSISDIEKSIPSVKGCAYVIENSGELIGVSGESKVTIEYPDRNSKTTFGDPQRVSAGDSSDPLIATTYQELVRRTKTNDTLAAGEASKVAQFSDQPERFVAEGTEVGRFLVETTRLTDELGLNWTTVIALSEESFMEFYRGKVVQGVVVGAGICGITIYILAILLTLSTEVEKNKRDDDEKRREEMEEKMEEEEEEVQHHLSNLSPDSEEFFDTWVKILRPSVESANLTMRIHNEEEPSPPSIFAELSQLLNLHKEPLLAIFSHFDADGSGDISFDEFGEGISKYVEVKNLNFRPTSSELIILFNALDKNGDGSISFKELMEDQDNIAVTESEATSGEKQRALRYIDMVYNRGLSLSYILSLERSLDFSRLQGYQLFESSGYKMIYGFFILISLCLAFLEAPAVYTNAIRTEILNSETNLFKDYILPINGVCLFVYVLDMAFEIWLRGFREGGSDTNVMGNDEEEGKDQNTSENGPPRPAAAAPPPAAAAAAAARGFQRRSRSLDVAARKYGTNASRIEMTSNGAAESRKKRKCCDLFDYKSGGKIRLLSVARLLLLLAFLFDFLYRTGGAVYFTGPREVLFLPVTSLMRPLWLLTRYRDVRRSLFNFVDTLIKAADVLILFFLLMTIGSIMGVLLLSGRMDDNTISNYNKFDNFLSGMLTLFVYMASAENYPDVAYPGSSCDQNDVANSLLGGVKSAGCPESFFHLYSMLFSFLGAFLIVSLVIGVFEAEFAENTKKQETEDRKKKRLGVIAAFILLDKDGGGSLDKNEFLSFINGTCNTGRQFEVQPGLELSGQEFMELIAELAHEIRFETHPQPTDIQVTPYRRCDICKIDVPREWVVGKRIKKQVKERNGKTVMYHYSVPVGVRPGQKNVSVCGLSEEKTSPSEDITFGTLDAVELAHWLCYTQGSGRFPFDPNGASTNVAADAAADAAAASDEEMEKMENQLSRDKELISYHRHAAADMCTTRSRLESSSSQLVSSDTMSRTASIANYEETTNRSGGGGGRARRGSVVLETAAVAADKMVEWKNNLRNAIKMYLNSQLHKSVMLVLTMCNITTLALYGTGEKTFVYALDYISVSFLIFGFLEILARIFCFGWRDFWYVNDDFFQQAANRFDFQVNCLTLIVIIIALVVKISEEKKLWFDDWQSQDDDDDELYHQDWTRLLLAVPILRAFSTIYIIRDIVMGMKTVFPQYVHVFTLLGVVFYFYACLGCLLFANEFKFNSSYEIPDANFNSMLDSLITLFQLFVGEAWNDVLQAALNTGKTVQALLYFISYSVIMTMLFTNLLIGIICSGYESIADVRKEHLDAHGGKSEVKLSVRAVTSALKEGEQGQRRLDLQYTIQGVIRLNRAKEFEEEDEDGNAREEKKMLTMYNISAGVVSAKNAARRWQTKTAEAGGETGQETKVVSV